jgi:benzoyl-CoA reductase/2-hydroxyglutaryl-CoA dehydratase subunit BcrC/BadD/HgdB
MTDDNKPTKPEDLKIVFAEGCFDNFEGTQEELDEMIAEINRMVTSGEIFEKSRPIDVDNMDEQELVALAQAMGLDFEELGIPEELADSIAKKPRTLQ